MCALYSLSLSPSLSHTYTHGMVYSLSLTHTQTGWFILPHSLTHTRTQTGGLFLSHTRGRFRVPYCPGCARCTPFLSHKHARGGLYPISLCHTHTHRHTGGPSLTHTRGRRGTGRGAPLTCAARTDGEEGRGKTRLVFAPKLTDSYREPGMST